MHRKFSKSSGSLRARGAWWAALVVLGATTEAHATLPTRAWGTYIGGSSYDYTAEVAVDTQGYVYVVGGSWSDGIATNGAHKTVQENSDAFLVKYTPDGTPLWGTYLGGADQDGAWGVAVRDGMVVLTGYTLSAEGIATPGAFQTEHIGSACAFAVAFTTDGVQTWGTYLCAGPESALGTNVAIDAQGAVYLGGTTEATIPGLTTPASHQPNYVGGGDRGDGYLAKLGAQGSLLWGTYYGGHYFERVHGVSINALGEIYVAGDTDSEAGMASPGAHRTSGKHNDGFLARFTADGVRMWGTYYGGAEDDDFTTVIALPQGGAVIAGQTSSIDGIATPGAHQPKLAGGIDSYLARFDAAGTRIWGTYNGGPGSEAGSPKVATDGPGNLYLVNMTQSLTGLATENAWQTQSGGGLYDMLVAGFDSDGARRWQTYYGGSHFELDLGLGASLAGDVYLVGQTFSPDGIASPGAHDTSLDGERDGFLVRLTQAAYGQPCDGPGDCKDGTCVDAVCCASACGGGADDCQVCAASKGASEDGICTLLGAEVVCRAADGACDPAEHCSGDAGACPDDALTPNGEACADGICQAGRCTPGEGTDSMSTDSTSTDSTSTDSTSTDSPATSVTSVDTTTSDDSSPTGDNLTGGGGSDGAPGADTGDLSASGTGDATDSTGDATTDAAVDGADGCGCRGAPGPSGPGGLLAALLLLRRRRR